MKKIIPLFVFVVLITSCKKESVTLPAANTDVASASLADKNEPVIYPFVNIFGQKWMSANLSVGRYRNGEKIPQCKHRKDWAHLTTGAWCWPNFDSSLSFYGKLYNFYAVHDLRGLAPNGWHVPSLGDMAALNYNLGGDADHAGGKLKLQGIYPVGPWEDPNAFATDEFGFSAYPAGEMNTAGYWGSVGIAARFWSSVSNNDGTACYMYLHYNNGNINLTFNGNNISFPYGEGLSVRCVKDPK